MVKIKTICRSDQDYTRETKQDIYKISKNISPNIHPFIKVTTSLLSNNSYLIQRPENIKELLLPPRSTKSLLNLSLESLMATLIPFLPLLNADLTSHKLLLEVMMVKLDTGISLKEEPFST